MTSNEAIGAEAANIFKKLSLNQVVKQTEHLMVAPKCLQNKVIERIEREIQAAKEGKEAYLGFKINSLTDKKIIDKLIEASQAGVKIEMVIRGICCLKAGIPGVTENISIISIVGRFLEHSRIYIFGKGEREEIYIASADFMTRNTVRRVEVAAPVYDEKSKGMIKDIFTLMLQDNCKARKQEPDGTYVRVPEGEKIINAQERLYEIAYEKAAGNGTAVKE